MTGGFVRAAYLLVGAAVAVVPPINMFLFPSEVDQAALAPGGVLLWVSTLGDATRSSCPRRTRWPAPSSVVGTASPPTRGWGTWLVARRAA